MIKGTRNTWVGSLYIGIIFISLLTVSSDSGFWHDEYYTLGFVRGFDLYLFDGSDLNTVDEFSSYDVIRRLNEDTFFQNLWRNIVHEGHPPIYYFIMKLWSSCFGYTEIGLRSFSVFCLAVSIWISSLISFELKLRKWWLLPVLTSLSPLLVSFSIEARSYALYFLFSLACALFFMRTYLGLNLAARDIKTDAMLFCLFGVLLLYTHYYGVFFYLSLCIPLFFSLIKSRSFTYLLTFIAPLLLFLPWMYIVYEQVNVHDVHWTDGYYGTIRSLTNFFSGFFGLIKLGVASTSSALIAVGVALMCIWNAKSWIRHNFGLVAAVCGIVLLYGMMIVGFDWLLDHHTSDVPRYYLPAILILLIGVSFVTDKGEYGIINLLASWAIIIIFLNQSPVLFKHEQPNKQMCKEVAHYINQTFNPDETTLVVTPNGPTAIGLAYYLRDDYRMVCKPPSDVCSEYDSENTVVVEQRLGLATEAWNQDCRKMVNSERVIRFVGIDVVSYEN